MIQDTQKDGRGLPKLSKSASISQVLLTDADSTTQNQSDYHLRAMVTWEHALESLDPTDMKLKDEYESELEGARELSISALELKDISSQPIGDDSPSDRVLCMPSVAQRLPSELVAGIQLSSVCVTIISANLDLLRSNYQASRLLAAYQVCLQVMSSIISLLTVSTSIDFPDRDTSHEPKEGGIACIQHA